MAPGFSGGGRDLAARIGTFEEPKSMSVRIRLARTGTKKRPFYRVIATNSRNPRDGRFLEKLGTYNPLLPNDNAERVVLKEERVRYWLDNGAKPSDRVCRFLDAAGQHSMMAGLVRSLFISFEVRVVRAVLDSSIAQQPAWVRCRQWSLS